MTRITGGRDGMEWGIIGGFGVEWASNYSWTHTSNTNIAKIILFLMCVYGVYLSKPPIFHKSAGHTMRVRCFFSSSPSAHALSLFSLFYALGADKEPLCASVCASRSSLSTSSCALCLLVQHIFGPSCSSAHLSTLIEQLPTSSLKRLHLNKVEERTLKVLKRRFSTTSLQPDG